MIEELDLRIFKALIENKVNAMTFSYRYDHTLFDFECQRFAKLFLDYTKHFRDPPTRRTLIDRHHDNPQLVDIINETWDEIDGLEYDTKEYSYDLDLLKNRFKERAVEKIREQASSDDPDNPENPDDYFSKISLEINKITSLDLQKTHTQITAADYVDDFSNAYETRKLNPESVVEISTGYSLIDELSGGLIYGDLIIVGGSTGSGKSQLLNNMAKQICFQDNTIDSDLSNLSKGYNVLYFSLEMPHQNCFIRFLASLADVPQRALSKSALTQEEYKKVNKAYSLIKKHQENGYYFDIVDVPRNLTIEEVELRYHDALLRYRPDVVLIDYMGLMHSTALAREQDWLKMGGIAASLHEFGRAYNCVMITAAQLTDLKRNATGSQEENRRVGVHRWGRSSLIMHNVNLAIQIEDRPNEESYGDLRYHIVKNRNGPLGQGNLVKNFANASLIDIPFNNGKVSEKIDIQAIIRSVQENKNKSVDN
jgi:replicative DNA helicase